jgi:hypothetical protein
MRLSLFWALTVSLFRHISVSSTAPHICGSLLINRPVVCKTQNRHLLRSGYVARTEKELAVLTRWFPADLVRVFVFVVSSAFIVYAFGIIWLLFARTHSGARLVLGHGSNPLALFIHFSALAFATSVLPNSQPQVEAPVASHLDVILYSRDQINLENAAMQQPAETYVRESDGAVVAEDAAWGIISIKPQMEAFETPVCIRAHTF